MQRQITPILLLALFATVYAESKVETNAVAPESEALEAQESNLVSSDKHQEKRYIPYAGVSGNGYYGSNVDSYYNPYNSRALGYGGYNNLGYGAAGYGGIGSAGYGGIGNAGYGLGGYGAGGYGSTGYGAAGYGAAGYGAAGYGGAGYGAAGYGTGYNTYGGYNNYNPYYNRPGYAGYRAGYGYNSYPSSYYSGGYGNSIVGGTLGALGGAAGIVPSVPVAGGYNYGVGTGTVY